MSVTSSFSFKEIFLNLICILAAACESLSKEMSNLGKVGCNLSHSSTKISYRLIPLLILVRLFIRDSDLMAVQPIPMK